MFICLHFSYIIKFFIFSLQLRYLELLKLRFGESHLHFCEIMLKDVAVHRLLMVLVMMSMMMVLVLVLVLVIVMAC